MLVKDLLKKIGIECNDKRKVEGISFDSRNIKDGYVFIAYKGNNSDGNDYIHQAFNNGAVCVISDRLVGYDIYKSNDIEKDKKLYLKKAYANFVYASVAGGDPIILTQAELKEKYGDFVWVSDEKLFGNEVIQEKKIKEMIEGKIKEGKVKNIKEVEPIYLRLSQAEYQYMEKHKGDK